MALHEAKTNNLKNICKKNCVLIKNIQQNLPICCNDAGNIRNISRCPNSFQPLHRVTPNLEHKLRETVAYNQLYCIAYRRQQWH